MQLQLIWLSMLYWLDDISVVVVVVVNVAPVVEAAEDTVNDGVVPVVVVPVVVEW